jgi:predicted ATPase
MGISIDKITLKGFKSIHSLEGFELKSLNVLIGANGSGKSNFVSFFPFLHEMVECHLEKAVNLAGRADSLLFLGPKITSKIECSLEFGDNGYTFNLERTKDGRLIFGDERIVYFGTSGPGQPVNRSIGTGHSESKLKAQIESFNRNKAISEYIYSAISRWVVYHVHDTSDTAAMRGECTIRDYESLRPDGSNLAAFLLRLLENEKGTYELIRDTIRLVAPFFDNFLLRPTKHGSDDFVKLEWKQTGSDFPFHPMQLSDGTMRFIALSTALLQPNPPATIVIDEPELGLHPYAISILADLIKSASERTQVIVSTQSPTLLDYFAPDEIVVVNRMNGKSTFARLDPQTLAAWMEDYSVGELWQKNVVQGGPTRE